MIFFFGYKSRYPSHLYIHIFRYICARNTVYRPVNIFSNIIIQLSIYIYTYIKVYYTIFKYLIHITV